MSSPVKSTAKAGSPKKGQKSGKRGSLDDEKQSPTQSLFAEKELLAMETQVLREKLDKSYFNEIQQTLTCNRQHKVTELTAENEKLKAQLDLKITDIVLHLTIVVFA